MTLVNNLDLWLNESRKGYYLFLRFVPLLIRLTLNSAFHRISFHSSFCWRARRVLIPLTLPTPPLFLIVFKLYYLNLNSHQVHLLLLYWENVRMVLSLVWMRISCVNLSLTFVIPSRPFFVLRPVQLDQIILFLISSSIP